MDLSEAPPDGASDSRHPSTPGGRPANSAKMTVPTTTDEAVPTFDDTPSPASKLAAACGVETTAVDEIWKNAGGLACLPGGLV